jgi:hypothetical protein
MKVNDRVRFTDKPYLSDGHIKRVINGITGDDIEVIK